MPISNHFKQRIAIIGGGVNGLVAALALKTKLGACVDVYVCDPARTHTASDQFRVVALAKAGLDLLKSLNIWEALEHDAQPIHQMCISDSALDEPLRSTLLTFSQALTSPSSNAPSPVASIIPNMRLKDVTRQKALAMGVIFLDRMVSDITQDVHGARLHVKGATPAMDTRFDLVILSDGAGSHLREHLDFGWVAKKYTQTALVGTISHQHDHQARAFQHFLPHGPFAILPLRPLAQYPKGLPYRSSLVWSEGTDVANDMLSHPDVLEAIRQRAGLELGEIALETPLHAFPLRLGLARSWVKGRVVLLGDSAHVFHPLAGQGLHLGLQDAEALCECIKEAVALGLSVSDAGALQKYERMRRPPAVAMALITDNINRLFSRESLALRLARQLGMGLLEKAPAIKGFLMRIPQGN